MSDKQKAHMLKMNMARTQKKLEKEELLRLKAEDKESKKAQKLKADAERKAELEELRGKKQKEKVQEQKSEVTKKFEKQVEDRESVSRYSKEQHEQLKFMDFMTQMQRYDQMKSHFAKKQSNQAPSPAPAQKPKPQPKKPKFNPVMPPLIEEKESDYIWFG